jgi:peptidoglycan/xylan/chitin deacetylase (PgdA/CDA1 family)
MPDIVLAIKVDVDTDRGTRVGVPKLQALFDELRIPATFLFSLGPDNTGRAIKRIFRPGFFRKVQRTSVVSTYGIRTLLNGTLLPGPHIGRRNAAAMRAVRDRGYEVGIHCYDHVRWQDGLENMSAQQVQTEFMKARQEFERIFSTPARTAGAAGWQANAFSLAAYDAAGLLYASDSRGLYPFYPRVNGVVFKTLQIPSTLPTLDELLGRPEFPEEKLSGHYLSLLRRDLANVMTVHAEIEGMQKLAWFREFLTRVRSRGVNFAALPDLAKTALKNPHAIPVSELIAGEIDGRSGMLALQRVSA